MYQVSNVHGSTWGHKLEATRKHFKHHSSEYGKTNLVNLVNHKGHEQPVKEAYEHQMAEVGLLVIPICLLN